MSAISDILGVKPKQEKQPVTPQANPQYPVDWQNGQTSSGGQAPSAIQGNTNPNYGPVSYTHLTLPTKRIV